MNIKEIITENVIDEYRIVGKYDPTSHIRHGDKFKQHLDLVKTPMAQFNVRHNKDYIEGTGDVHEYYLYDKKTDKCVGLFSVEMQKNNFSKILKPGVKAVTPHMALAPEVQRQGVSTQAYTTFLRGGPWVFVTDHHTKGASKLWDSITTGDIISLYINDETGTPISRPLGYHDTRILGPRDRFNLSK